MPKTIEEILNETLAPEMKASLQEAFDAKISAMREEVEESVRSDIAARYEHDKSQLVEAMDKMLSDVIRVHEEVKAKEIAQLSEARSKYKQAIGESKKETRARVARMVESSTKIISESLAAEVKALREQKVAIAKEAATLSEGVETVKGEVMENHKAHLAKINEFVVRQVAAEIKEFEQDKRALVETRVKLIAENKKKLAEAQAKFIKEAASKVEESINATLSTEMQQLHEDVERYRQNQFGREIFEAFASTYMASHLSEGSEVKKLQAILESKEAEIAAAKSEVENTKVALTEAQSSIKNAERKVVITEERARRNKIMGDLLSNLRGEKRSVMESMLETTKTGDLKNAFEKLLPVVLSEGTRKAAPVGKNVLNETKAVSAPAITGDRMVREEPVSEVDQSIAEIVHLAGIKKI